MTQTYPLYAGELYQQPLRDKEITFLDPPLGSGSLSARFRAAIEGEFFFTKTALSTENCPGATSWGILANEVLIQKYLSQHLPKNSDLSLYCGYTEVEDELCILFKDISPLKGVREEDEQEMSKNSLAYMFSVQDNFEKGSSKRWEIRQKVKATTPRDLGEVVFIAKEVAFQAGIYHSLRAEGEGRNGIVHMDISPGNILVYKDSDEKTKVLLVDFGIARENGKDPLRLFNEFKPGEVSGNYYSSKRGEFLVNAIYHPPNEQEDYKKEIDPSYDTYNLTNLLCLMVTGKLMEYWRGDYRELHGGEAAPEKKIKIKQKYAVEKVVDTGINSEEFTVNHDQLEKDLKEEILSRYNGEKCSKREAEQLAKIIVKGTAYEKAERYAEAKDLAQALEALGFSAPKDHKSSVPLFLPKRGIPNYLNVAWRDPFVNLEERCSEPEIPAADLERGVRQKLNKLVSALPAVIAPDPREVEGFYEGIKQKAEEGLKGLPEGIPPDLSPDYALVSANSLLGNSAQMINAATKEAEEYYKSRWWRRAWKWGTAVFAEEAQPNSVLIIPAATKEAKEVAKPKESKKGRKALKWGGAILGATIAGVAIGLLVKGCQSYIQHTPPVINSFQCPSEVTLEQYESAVCSLDLGNNLLDRRSLECTIACNTEVATFNAKAYDFVKVKLPELCGRPPNSSLLSLGAICRSKSGLESELKSAKVRVVTPPPEPVPTVEPEQPIVLLDCPAEAKSSDYVKCVISIIDSGDTVECLFDNSSETYSKIVEANQRYSFHSPINLANDRLSYVTLNIKCMNEVGLISEPASAQIGVHYNTPPEIIKLDCHSKIKFSGFREYWHKVLTSPVRTCGILVNDDQEEPLNCDIFCLWMGDKFKSGEYELPHFYSGGIFKRVDDVGIKSRETDKLDFERICGSYMTSGAFRLRVKCGDTEGKESGIKAAEIIFEEYPQNRNACGYHIVKEGFEKPFNWENYRCKEISAEDRLKMQKRGSGYHLPGCYSPEEYTALELAVKEELGSVCPQTGKYGIALDHLCCSPENSSQVLEKAYAFNFPPEIKKFSCPEEVLRPSLNKKNCSILVEDDHFENGMSCKVTCQGENGRTVSTLKVDSHIDRTFSIGSVCKKAGKSSTYTLSLECPDSKGMASNTLKSEVKVLSSKKEAPLKPMNPAAKKEKESSSPLHFTEFNCPAEMGAAEINLPVSRCFFETSTPIIIQKMDCNVRCMQDSTTSLTRFTDVKSGVRYQFMVGKVCKALENSREVHITMDCKTSLGMSTPLMKKKVTITSRPAIEEMANPRRIEEKQ